MAWSIPPDQSAVALLPNSTFLDHEYRNVTDLGPTYVAFNDRCQRALRETIWREREGLLWPQLLTDPLEGVRVGHKARENDPRILYFIGASRPSAAIMVSRLLLALYHPSHLFIVHVDLKAAEQVSSELDRLTRDHPNVHLMRNRRLVQWGAWTMVITMLDAINSVVAAGLDFDFFINLSDVDVALRTNDEIVEFLRPHPNRQFVQVHMGTGEWLEKARNFTRAHAVVECGGYGYVAVNSSQPIELGGGPQCCFGRGGPVVYTNTSELHLHDAREVLANEWAQSAKEKEERQQQQSGDGDEGKEEAGAASSSTAVNESLRLHTGSQWVILDRAFATYLVRDERAAKWIRVFERRFLSDESFVQTVLMHSPYKDTLVNHNMRYIYWPHFDGDPTSYWARMGASFIGGPQVINQTRAPEVFRSPYMFARKVDPTVDAKAVTMWDEWMAKKLRGERPDDQAVLGGHQRRTGENADDSLERQAAAAAAAAAASAAGSEATDAPRLHRPPLRRVSRVKFEDGSECECTPDCEARNMCCWDWGELCEQGRSPATPSGGIYSSVLTGRACPAPTNPPLTSAVRRGTPIRLTFLNHARYPLKVIYLPSDANSRETEMGYLRANGATLTLETRDSHAYAVRSWSGVTVLEVPPSEGRRTSTIDVYECELAKRALHQGWK